MNKLIVMLLLATVALGVENIWIEGEAPTRHNFVKHPGYDDVDKQLLSGKEWLSHYSETQKGKAEYEFRVKHSGLFTWWLRCNVLQAKLAYKLDDGKYKTIDLSKPTGAIRVSQKPDFRSVAWVKVTEIAFQPGVHTLTIGTFSSRGNHGAIDCMCFSNTGWEPAGVSRPGALATGDGPGTAGPGPQTPPAADTGTVQLSGPNDLTNPWFTLAAGEDPYSPASITDMSKLLPKPAGSFGSLMRHEDNLIFQRKRDPVKFWGVNALMPNTPELQEKQAKFYAKCGVNMVRIANLPALLGVLRKEPGSGRRVFDKEKLDRLDRWFAYLKDHGIYMTWCCFNPHVITAADAYDPKLFGELPELGEGRSAAGMVNFMPELQKAEFYWLTVLLRHKNPYTGTTYAEDPALAILELHEDDTLFGPFPLDLMAEGRFPAHRAALAAQWMEWAKRRYLDDDRLKERWGSGMREGDSIDNPNVQIYSASQMRAAGPPESKERTRMGDFIRFLAQTQRAYFAERRVDLRRVGFRGLTVSAAGYAAGGAADAANFWCDDMMDLVDRHAYFGGGAGKDRVATGDVNNQTHLARPGSGLLSMGMYQAEDKPFMIGAWAQMAPNQWQAEAGPLVAFYGMGLQGWDLACATQGQRDRLETAWARSANSDSPLCMALFPALSLAVHNAHFKQGPLFAARRIVLDDIFQGSDVLRQTAEGEAGRVIGSDQVPLEALAMGRVTVKVGNRTIATEVMDLDLPWDRQESVVKSLTGELAWHYGKRVVIASSPKTQGLIGFVGGAEYDLPAFKVKLDSGFAVLLFSALDDLPLQESKHILVTAMARAQQMGSDYSEDGMTLKNLGQPPLLFEPVRGRLSMKGGGITSVRTVDVYGVPTDQGPTVRENGFDIGAGDKCFYYEIKR